MKTDSDFAILPYNSAKISDRFLVTTQFGGWSLLTRDELSRLNRFDVSAGTDLFNRLKESGVLINKGNIERVISDFRLLHRNWFLDAGLHIIVLTGGCNFNCVYCQASETKKGKMTKEVALKILEFIFSGRNPSIRIEFQGGEPLLDWENLKFIVLAARRKNEYEKKNLDISLVTNMSLLDNKKADFLIKHDVGLCTSLDGPAFLHDKNRTFKSGAGTYEIVIGWINKLQERYKGTKSRRRVSALPTITRFSLSYPREIVDEYVNLGLESIFLRPLNRIGRADSEWGEIGYTPEEFNDFWAAAMDYIIELNKQGKHIRENFSVFALKKILMKRDPLYTDLESPCGAGRSQIDYMSNGDIYTCDEARMLGDDTFKLGNVLKDKFPEVMRSENLFYACQSSLLELWDYNSAYSCWSGTCPVLNYFQQKNPVVKITQTAKHKIHNFQFEYLFTKITEDEGALDIFKNWIRD